MKLLFIRHGDPDYENDSLTELGKSEAKALAARLEGMPVDEFFVSPLGRARETAGYTLSLRSEDATVYDWLQEFDAPIKRPDKDGDMGITWDWLPQDWSTEDEFLSVDTWADHPIMKEADVISKYNEVAFGLDKILEKYGYIRDGRIYKVREDAGETTLCFFCHYGVTCVMLSHLLSISPMLLWHGFAAAPASITQVLSEERRRGIASFRVSRYGDVAHILGAGLPDNPRARFTEFYDDSKGRRD